MRGVLAKEVAFSSFLGRRSTGPRSGMSLVELTVVMAVLLVLVSLVYVGARGWQRGTERARCILQIRQMQMSVRGYATANEFAPGADLSELDPPVNLLAELVGPGKYVPSLPTCPGSGLYLFGGDVIPEKGQLYMSCSLATDQAHVPDDHSAW